MPDRPLRSDARDNRAKILTAARSAFEELGPEANLREIAHRAGVAQGTVHRHFPTKQALFSAIAIDRLQDLAALARALGTQRPPGPAFLTFVTETADQARQNRSLATVFEEADNQSAVRAAAQQLTTALGALLTEAQADGAIRDDIDVADVHAITAALIAVDSDPNAADADRARRIGVLLDGLRPQAH